MKIYLSGRNASSSLTANSTNSFSQYLYAMDLLSMDFSDGNSLFVCFDIDQAALRLMKRLKIAKDKAILVRNEPEVVCPENYRSTYLSRFGKIIDIGRPAPRNSLVARWPQNWPPEVATALGGLPQNQNRLVMVNANKLSFVKGELYSLRRHCMRSLPLDTYGFGWDKTWFQKTKTLVGELLIVLRNLQAPSFSATRFWFGNSTQTTKTVRNGHGALLPGAGGHRRH